MDPHRAGARRPSTEACRSDLPGSRALRCELDRSGPCVTVVRHPLSHVDRTPCASDGLFAPNLRPGAALVWIP